MRDPSALECASECMCVWGEVTRTCTCQIHALPFTRNVEGFCSFSHFNLSIMTVGDHIWIDVCNLWHLNKLALRKKVFRARLVGFGGKEEPLTSQELLHKDGQRKTNHIFTPYTNFSGLALSVNSRAMLMRSSTRHPPPHPSPSQGSHFNHWLSSRGAPAERETDRERETLISSRDVESSRNQFLHSRASSCWGNWKCDWA